MFRRLEFWGGLVTVIYLLVIGAFVFIRLDDFFGLKLNELGDFLAGSFGPIAFLWLVLGFLQQGRELKLSTDALKLQAEELKNSVEQQTIMAEAATAQIDAQLRSLKIQQDEIERSILPRLEFESGSRSGGVEAGASIRTSTTLKNAGAEVWDVAITFDPPIGDVQASTIGRLQKNAKSSPIQFNFVNAAVDKNGTCTVSYTRSDAKRITETFTYLIKTSNPFILVEKPRPTPVD